MNSLKEQPQIFPNDLLVPDNFELSVDEQDIEMLFRDRECYPRYPEGECLSILAGFVKLGVREWQRRNPGFAVSKDGSILTYPII